MDKLQVSFPLVRPNAYDIFVQSDLLAHPERWLTKDYLAHTLVLITDHHVKKLYGDRLARALKKQGFKVLVISIAPGEKSKVYKTKQYIEKIMLQNYCDRNTLILALGGGVVGDLAGFVAATFMRGIAYIQIPTTLLAMIDSSVGGKTAIDTDQGKNLIGAYWQPLRVVTDLACVATLTRELRVCGLIEAIKMFLTNDHKSFNYACDHLEDFFDNDESILKSIIIRALKIKSYVVKRDEKEAGMRMILNFGHTIGHALEQLSNYKMLHGYAVAYGILIEAKISQLLGLLDETAYQRIYSVLVSLGIKANALKKFDVNQVIKMTRADKKTTAGKVRYVLLKKIGQVQVAEHAYAHVVADKLVKKAFLEVVGE